jgi:hypothetical protein
MGVVNSNATLQDTNGIIALYHEQRGSPALEQASLQARRPGPAGFNVGVDYRVTRAVPGSGLETNVSFTSQFNDNADVLTARGAVFLKAGFTNLTASFALVTTNLADGPHVLTAVSYEGTAVRVQGRTRIPFIVDNNTALCAITNPAAGATILLGQVMTAQVDASAGAPVTSVVFYAEGKLLAATGAVPYVFSFNTTNYGVGSVTLQAKAFASNGDTVLSSNVTVTILPDYDFDGLDDNWEIQNWGSITNYTGVDDPDTDHVSNADEYTADTQPTNPASYFRFNGIQWINGLAQLEYVSSTNWLQGDSGVTTQLDDGTVMPLPTNMFRFYRVQAHRP